MYFRYLHIHRISRLLTLLRHDTRAISPRKFWLNKHQLHKKIGIKKNKKILREIYCLNKLQKSRTSNFNGIAMTCCLRWLLSLLRLVDDLSSFSARTSRPDIFHIESESHSHRHCVVAVISLEHRSNTSVQESLKAPDDTISRWIRPGDNDGRYSSRESSPCRELKRPSEAASLVGDREGFSRPSLTCPSAANKNARWKTRVRE